MVSLSLFIGLVNKKNAKWHWTCPLKQIGLLSSLWRSFLSPLCGFGGLYCVFLVRSGWCFVPFMLFVTTVECCLNIKVSRYESTQERRSHS